jgi:hypothetical protein
MGLTYTKASFGEGTEKFFMEDQGIMEIIDCSGD